MNDSPRLPYLWKIVVAAAAVAIAIVAVRELPKLIPASTPVPQPTPSKSTAPIDLYADTLARIREIIALHTANVPEVVTPTMPLMDLGLDPLTRIEVADALETAYRIELTTDELSAAATVEDLVQLVVKKRDEAIGSR